MKRWNVIHTMASGKTVSKIVNANTQQEAMQEVRELLGSNGRVISAEAIDADTTEERAKQAADSWNQNNAQVKDARMTSDQIRAKIKSAPKGAIATGGGYGPFIKLGTDSWKAKGTGRLMNDEGLYERIGDFSDFKIR